MPEIAPQTLIDQGPRGLLREVINSLWGAYHRVSGRVRYDDYRLEQVGESRLLVLPSVANPNLLRTGAWFAEVIGQLDMDATTRVLDLGCGSGICAITAARRATRVVASDINPAALRCTRINALMNRVEERIECREGDLFAPLAGLQFDLVLFNPPFITGRPRNGRDAAWRSPDAAARFAQGVGDHLAPGGQALLLLSSFGDACVQFEQALRREGFTLGVHARRRFVNEALTLLSIRKDRT